MARLRGLRRAVGRRLHPALRARIRRARAHRRRPHGGLVTVVVVPEGRDAAELLAAVVDQTYPSLEIVVVADEAGVRAVRGYARWDPRIRTVDSWAAALQGARGDLLTVVGAPGLPRRAVAALARTLRLSASDLALLWPVGTAVHGLDVTQRPEVLDAPSLLGMLLRTPFFTELATAPAAPAVLAARALLTGRFDLVPGPAPVATLAPIEEARLDELVFTHTSAEFYARWRSAHRDRSTDSNSAELRSKSNSQSE